MTQQTSKAGTEHRILVTGASGFIGEHLARRLLNDGAQTRCLVRASSRVDRLQEMGAELTVGDVGDRDSLISAVRGAQVVYHLAGANQARSADEFLRVNEQGTRNVAAACAAQESPPVLVYTSSLAAAGPARESRPCVESDPPAPVSHYGSSKLAGEQCLWELASEVPISIVRPPCVFGPQERFFFRMLQTAYNGRVIAPVSREHRYSLVHIEDLVACLVLAASCGNRLPAVDSSEDRPGIYYVAHDEQPTWTEVGNLFAQVCGRPSVRTFQIPRSCCWTVGAGAELLSRCLRRHLALGVDKMREATAGSWLCSNARAKQELGFQPKDSLAVRLDETARWYRKHGWL